MRTPKLFTLVTAALIATASIAFVACSGGPPPEPKTANIQPGEMPPGAVWDGVYFNAIWGNLHIVATGNNFEGRWLRTDESAWGEMKGKITGDIARFDWKEHTIGLVGASGTRTGKGYFRYVRPEGANLDDQLKGEWGFKDAEIGGGEWDSIKQRNKPPKLDSIGGETEPTVGNWN
ncbi:MAG: hypothetical protein FWD57_01675 [Polyangiaceae bacterium]|nr:hypothetical protein [Polyangiaceae bacterium]